MTFPPGPEDDWTGGGEFDSVELGVKGYGLREFDPDIRLYGVELERPDFEIGFRVPIWQGVRRRVDEGCLCGSLSSTRRPGLLRRDRRLLGGAVEFWAGFLPSVVNSILHRLGQVPCSGHIFRQI